MTPNTLEGPYVDELKDLYGAKQKILKRPSAERQ